MREQQNRKQGQAQQVFIYLITIIVIGLLFFFGIKALSKLWDTQEQIDIVQFKTDLETAFDKIRPNYGSSVYEEFRIPSEIEKVCFVEQDYKGHKPSKGLCDPEHDDYNPIICDAWDGETDENIFFEPALDTPVYLDKIKVGGDDGYKCFSVQRGSLELELVGLGDAVKIS